MNDIQYSTVKNPSLEGLQEFTKNPANYIPIQKKLLETLACKKTHSDPSEVFECKTCTENMIKRRKLMADFGFKSPAQYMAWKATQEEIKKRKPFDMYNRLAGIKNKTI